MTPALIKKDQIIFLELSVYFNDNEMIPDKNKRRTEDIFKINHSTKLISDAIKVKEVNILFIYFVH